jgi:hypothetical protein
MDALPKVREILAYLSGVDRFPDDIRLGAIGIGGVCGPHDGTLGLDSLDRLEAAMALEEAFEVEIGEEDSEREEMRTPEGIAAWIEAKLEREGR